MERSARVRIGRVKLRGGADLHIHDGGRGQRAARMRAWFEHHARFVSKSYGGEMAGYVLVAWNADGAYDFRFMCAGENPSMNTLPHWLAEAARRAVAREDMRRILDLPPQPGD